MAELIPNYLHEYKQVSEGEKKKEKKKRKKRHKHYPDTPLASCYFPLKYSIPYFLPLPFVTYDILQTQMGQSYYWSFFFEAKQNRKQENT